MMTKKEHDKIIALNNTYLILKIKDINNIVRRNSDLWRYLFLLEYNKINYLLTVKTIYYKVETQDAILYYHLDGEYWDYFND